MKKKLQEFHKEFRKQSSVAIVAAFGFLIALSWRDFVSEVVTHIVESVQGVESVYMLKLLAAVVVTVVSIIGIMAASKLNVKEEEEEKKPEKKPTKKKKKK
jgi:small-conductance mechanosensitive channel